MTVLPEPDPFLKGKVKVCCGVSTLEVALVRYTTVASLRSAVRLYLNLNERHKAFVNGAQVNNEEGVCLVDGDKIEFLNLTPSYRKRWKEDLHYTEYYKKFHRNYWDREEKERASASISLPVLPKEPPWEDNYLCARCPRTCTLRDTMRAINDSFGVHGA